jgi:hypothetical protein
MKKLLVAATLAAGIALASPTIAQEVPYTPGAYMVVQGIYVKDGQSANYLDYLSGTFSRSQDIAKQRGWITSFRVFANVNRRRDEPDLYLITEMPRQATPQEQVERERILNQAMSQTTRQAEEASGRRLEMRTLGSSILLQEMSPRAGR